VSTSKTEKSINTSLHQAEIEELIRMKQALEKEVEDLKKDCNRMQYRLANTYDDKKLPSTLAFLHLLV